jgi:hypothetical protein
MEEGMLPVGNASVERPLALQSGHVENYGGELSRVFEAVTKGANLPREAVGPLMFFGAVRVKVLDQEFAHEAVQQHRPMAGNGLPVSDRLAEEAISLPMHPSIDKMPQGRIIDSLRASLS